MSHSEEQGDDLGEDPPLVVLTVADPSELVGGVILGAFPDAPPPPDRRELLSDDAHHRIQNTLAIVLSLARITARSCTTIDEFQKAFGDRIQAMAKTNALLLRGAAREIKVRAALELELAPYAGQGRQIVLQCADLAISADSALNLSLLIHELASNAARHGALSSADGSLFVACRRAGGDAVLTWRETAPGATPRTAGDGAGSVLIARLAKVLGGAAHLDFRPEGLEATVTFKLDGAVAD